MPSGAGDETPSRKSVRINALKVPEMASSKGETFAPAGVVRRTIADEAELAPASDGHPAVCVRAAVLSDAPAMAALDASGWPPPLQSMSEAEVRARV